MVLVLEAFATMLSLKLLIGTFLVENLQMLRKICPTVLLEEKKKNKRAPVFCKVHDARVVHERFGVKTRPQSCHVDFQ